MLLRTREVGCCECKKTPPCSFATYLTGPAAPADCVNTAAGALAALKKKKLYEQQLEAAENNIQRINEQQGMLEEQRAQVVQLQAMRNAAQASKATMQELDVQSVDKVLDEINEQADQMAQIQDAMSQPMGGAAALDEDELLAELEVDHLKSLLNRSRLRFAETGSEHACPRMQFRIKTCSWSFTSCRSWMRKNWTTNFWSLHLCRAHACRRPRSQRRHSRLMRSQRRPCPACQPGGCPPSLPRRLRSLSWSSLRPKWRSESELRQLGNGPACVGLHWADQCFLTMQCTP